MSKLRVNYGGEDWHVDMTGKEFEEALYRAKELDQFIVMPRMLYGRPHSKIAIRPQCIQYYYEEL